MTITSLICCVVTTLVASGLTIACYYAGKKDQKDNEEAHPIAMCVVFLFIFGLISFGASYLMIGSVFGKDMLRRLNMPIVSSQQLYGYEIVSKKTQKGGSSQTCFIDLKDLLKQPHRTAYTLLKNIWVSEEFFEELEVGQCFPPELAIDPNNPTEEQ